ncbi:hypothetical protein V3N99_05890 [Dermatophilaceae bacterium Soc4.6]
MAHSRSTSVRALVIGLLAVVCATGVASCSTVDKVSAAAIVDGDRITSDQLATTTEQFNSHLTAALTKGQQVPESAILNQLVLGKALDGYLAMHGGFKQSLAYAQLLALVPSPTARTQDLVRSVVALGDGSIPQADQAQLFTLAKKMKVELNPRYGTFDPSRVALVSSTPNWIKPGSPDPAATAPAAPQQ